MVFLKGGQKRLPTLPDSSKNQKKLINTKFSLDNLDSPEVKAVVGEKLISAVKTLKKGNNLSELQLSTLLDADRKETAVTRKFMKEAIESNAYLTAGAIKKLSQTMDTVAEASALRSATKEFK